MPARKPPSSKTKPVSDKIVTINLRLPEELLQGVDEWLGKVNGGHLRPKWSRTDMLRAIVARALQERGAKGEDP